MNESSVTQNRKKRKISDALNESPMTHFGRVLMQNNDLAKASNESGVTFRSCCGTSLYFRWYVTLLSFFPDGPCRPVAVHRRLQEGPDALVLLKHGKATVSRATAWRSDMATHGVGHAADNPATDIELRLASWGRQTPSAISDDTCGTSALRR